MDGIPNNYTVLQPIVAAARSFALCKWVFDPSAVLDQTHALVLLWD